MQNLASLLRGNARQYGMIIALGVLIILFQITTGGILLKPLNLTNLITQNSYILVLAIGMVIVIIARHIDLSVGSVAAFVGAVGVILMVKMNVPWPLAVIAALLVGALIGAWHGFWVAYVGIPAFIVTLSSMLLFRGLTLAVLQGETVGGLPKGFESLGNGFLPNIIDHSLHLTTLVLAGLLSAFLVYLDLRKRASKVKYGFAVSNISVFILRNVVVVGVLMAAAYLLAQYKGLPIVGLVLFILIGAYSFMMNRTPLGRHVYAVGGNYAAATMSGVRTKRVDFLVMMNMGILAGLAGLIFAARLTAANPKAGTNFELDAIAASFIGGAAVTGGVGTVIGAMIGGLVMGVLNNGMSLMGVAVDWQQAIKGLVLLAAVAFDVWNKRRSTVSDTEGTGVPVEGAGSTGAPDQDQSIEVASHSD